MPELRNMERLSEEIYIKTIPDSAHNNFWRNNMEPYKEILEKISKPFILDDAPNLYRHKDPEGRTWLVSIPENEEDHD